MEIYDNVRPILRRLCRPASLAVAVAWLMPAIAAGQDWQFEPMIQLGAEFDDNARLDTRTDEEVELQGVLAELAAGFSYTSETTTFRATPRVLVRRYDNEPDYDSEDVFLNVRHAYAGTRNNFGFRLDYDEQTVRTAERSIAELDEGDPGAIEDDSTGRVGLTGTRAKGVIAPYWQYRLARDSMFGLDMVYFDVDYDDDLFPVLIDYTDLRANASFFQAFSEKTTGIITGSVRQFEQATTFGTEIDGWSARAGFIYDFSPQTELRVLGGVETTAIDDQNDIQEPVGEVSLRHNLETIRFLALYRRLITASGSGRLSVRDSVMINATRDLTQKVNAGVGLRAYKADNIQETDRDSRTQVQLRARFGWNFTRALSMTVDYRYTILDRGAINGESANSNQVYLWFTWEPKPRG